MPKSKFSGTKEGIREEIQNKEVSGTFRCRVGGAKRLMEITVVARQQTVEEEQKCTAAIKLLLTELSRQQLGCKEKEND